LGRLLDVAVAVADLAPVVVDRQSQFLAPVDEHMDADNFPGDQRRRW
jgi:hypothetical protein